MSDETKKGNTLEQTQRFDLIAEFVGKNTEYYSNLFRVNVLCDWFTAHRTRFIC